MTDCLRMISRCHVGFVIGNAMGNAIGNTMGNAMGNVVLFDGWLYDRSWDEYLGNLIINIIMNSLHKL